MKGKVAAVLVIVVAGLWIGLRHRPAGSRSEVAAAPGTDDPQAQRLISQHQRRQPPKLAPDVMGPKLDPASADYDPNELAKRIGGLAAAWRQEPRLEPWASRVEAYLVPQVRADLTKILPYLRDVDVECHTGICRFAYQGPASREEQVEVMTVISQLYTGTAASGPGPDAYYVSYLGGHAFPGHYWPGVRGDADGLLGELRGQRDGWLADAAAGNMPPHAYQYIPKERWLSLLQR